MSVKRAASRVVPANSAHRFTRNRITVALLVSAGALPAWAASFDPGSNAITLHNGQFVGPNGDIVMGLTTATSATTNGRVTDITTTTVRGSTGFNSFGTFNVGVGNTVNLHVPGGAQNLVNLVHDARAEINGTLNGLKDGKIGGNIIFADPHGLVVGAQGVVNVGSLTVSTPNALQMQQLASVAANGSDNAAQQAVEDLQAGEYHGGDGAVEIRGKVNAAGSLNLFAASALVETGAKLNAGAQVFGATVNTDGVLEASAAVRQDGKIQIVANEGATIGGELAALMASGKGGELVVSAETLVLNNGARITSKGQAGQDSGSVKLMGQRSLTLNGDATVDSRASGTGKAGAVTLQAASLKLKDTSKVLTGASGTGSSGNITVRAASDLSFTGRNADGSAIETLDQLATSVRNQAKPLLAANLGKAEVVIEKQALLDASHAVAGKAGDVRVEALAVDKQLGGYAEAKASIDLAGTVRGKDISVRALADAKVAADILGSLLDTQGLKGDIARLKELNSWTEEQTWSHIFDTLTGAVDSYERTLDLGVLMEKPENFSELAALLPFVSVSIAQADARVTLADSAVLSSSGSLDLRAESARKVDTSTWSIPVLNGKIPFNAGLAYGRLGGQSLVEVKSGATLSGQNLTLLAHSLNNLSVSATSANTHDAEGKPLTTMGFAFGMAHTDLETKAQVADGARLTISNDVSVSAVTEQTLSNEVEFKAIGKGATGGPAVALTLFDSQTHAIFDADLSGARNLNVSAANLVYEQSNSALVQTGKNAQDHLKAKVLSDPAVKGFIDGVTAKIKGFFSTDPKPEEPKPGEPPKPSDSKFRLASATAIGIAEHETKAIVGSSGSQPSLSLRGDLSIAALQEQRALHNSADSTVNANVDKGDGSKVSVSIAAVYSQLKQKTQALIGDGSRISASHIGLWAKNLQSLDLAGLDRWSSLSGVFANLKLAATSLPDIPGRLSTSYANSSSESKDFSLAGSVTVLNNDFDAQAWVGNGVNLVASAADSNWSSNPFATLPVLKDEDGEEDEDRKDLRERRLDWSSPLSVLARNDIQQLAIAGNFWWSLFNNSSDGKAAGAGLNIQITDNDALAGIGSGGSIKAQRVAVDARQDELIIGITPTAGKGASVAGTGSLVVNVVDSTVHASIHNSTAVEADHVGINALHQLGLWGASGALASSEAAGIGAGVAVNVLSTDVQALVGENRLWRPSDWQAVADITSKAQWRADEVTLSAKSDGQSGAFSVAAAMARTEQEQKEQEQAEKSEGGADSGVRGLVNRLGGTVGQLVLGQLGIHDGLVAAKNGAVGIKDTVMEAPQKLQSLWDSFKQMLGSGDSSGGGDQGDAPKLTFAAAGSGSINVSGQKTRARLGDIVLDPRDPAKRSKVTVLSLNQTHQLSGSGSGALTLAGGQKSERSSALAGAIAYNHLYNTTTALLENSTLNANSVLKVQAASAGDQVAMGLGLAASSAGNSNLAVALSGSGGVIMNTTRAAVENSRTNQVAGTIEVTAYDRSRVLLGGGAFAGSNGQGTSAGGSLVFGLLKNSLKAEWLGSSASGFSQMDVSANSASRVLAGALAGAVAAGSSSKVGSGSLVTLILANDVSASVNKPTQGLSVLQGGALNIRASSVAGLGALDSVFDATGNNTLAGSGLDLDGKDTVAQIDGKLDTDDDLFDAEGDAGTTTGHHLFTGELAGEAVLAVAGNLAATSGQKAVGGAASLVYSGSQYSASLTNASVDLTGNLAVTASNNVDVLAAAVGAAGAQGTAVSGSATAVIGRGSVTANVDMTGQVLSAADMLVKAYKTGGAYSLAGNITGSSSNASVGGAVSLTDMEQLAEAKVQNGRYVLSGDATVGAGLQSRIITAALSGQVSGSGSAVGGALTYNRIGDHTRALLHNATLSANDLSLTASQPELGASIWALAFNLSAAGGNAGVGAGVAVNVIEAYRSAKLTDSTVNLTGKADLRSSLDGDIWGVGIDAAGGNTAGVGGSIVVNVINGQDEVLIDKSRLSTSMGQQLLNLDASGGHGLRIASLTGSVTGGGTAAVGGAVSINRIGADRTALIRGSSISGFSKTSLKSGADQDIYAVAVAAGGAGNVSVNGSSTSNVLEGTERAAIENSTVLEGSLSLSAAEGDRTIWSLAGALSGAGAVAVGVANANNIILSTRAAEVTDSTVTIGGTLTVQSGGASHIRSAAVGAGGAGNAAAGASLAINVIEGTESALIKNSTIKAGSLVVEAVRGQADIFTLAGNVQGAGNGAGAGAVAVSTVKQKRTAQIMTSLVDLGSGDGRVEAKTQGTITTLALSGAGAGSAALAFSNTSNNIAAQTLARVDGSGGQAAKLQIFASDDSDIRAGSGGASGAGAVAVGGATAINRIESQIDAALTGNREGGWALRNLQLDAHSAGRIIAAAVAGGGSGTVAVMAVAATNIIQNQIRAYISDAAKVTAQNNIGISARNIDSILSNAGVAGVSGNATVSGIATVNLILGHTKAFIDGALTQVNALGKDAQDKLLIDNGALLNAPNSQHQWISGEQFNPLPNLGIAQHHITGLAVQASSIQQVGQMAVSLSVGVIPILGAAVAGVGNSTVISGSTLGYINAAKINQAAGADSAQQVRVGANSHSYAAGYLAAAALGASAAGVSASLDSTVISRQVLASVRDSRLSSVGHTDILAGSSQAVSTLIANIAGAIVGVGGSASLVILDGQTEALVEGASQLQVGSLKVGASAIQQVATNAGSASGGAVAVSGALATLYNRSVTRAWVGRGLQDSAVSAAQRARLLAGDVDITALNKTSLLMNVASAGGGAGAVGGSVGISVVETTTEAGASQTDFGLTGQPLGSLSIKARDDLDVLSNVGSVQVGGLSVGGSANVLVSNSATRALFDRASLVGSAFTLEALRLGDIRLNTLTGAVGGSALSGSMGLLLLGTGATEVVAGGHRVNPLDELDKGGKGSLSQANTLGRVDKSADITYQDYQWNSTTGRYELVTQSDAAAKSKINSGSKAEIGSRLGASGASTFKQETVARSSASTLQLSQAAQIKAEDRLQSNNLVGAAGLGGGSAVGGAFALTLSNARVSADLVGGQLTAASLDLLAQAVDASDKAQLVRAVSGQAGFGVSMGAGVAIALMNNQVSSRLGGQLQTSQLLSAKALDSQSQVVDADGAAIGGVGAAGMVMAVAQRQGNVLLSVDDNASVSAGQLSLSASASGLSSAQSIGAAGGLLAAGNASVAIGEDRRRVQASTGNDVQLQVLGGTAALLKASAVPQVSATAIGAVLGGGLGLGASVANASVGSSDARLQVQALLGQRNRIKGNAGISVQASLATPAGQPGVEAKSYAGTGSLYYSANASVARATQFATVTAQTGSSLILEGGSFDLLANSTTSQRAEALGISVGGLLGVGAALAEAGSEVDTRALLGDSARLLGLAADSIGDVRIQAQGEDRNLALSTSGSGGLISGNAALAKTWSRGLVDAILGTDVQLRVRGLDILAQHRSVFGSRASSINAALLGASGAESDNQADVDTRVAIGEDAQIRTAADLQLRSSNQFVSDHGGDSAAAAGGGVVSGQAAINRTTLAGDSQAIIGARAQLLAGSNPGINATGKLSVRAESTLQADETVTLNTGGALAGGGAENSHEAQLNNLVQVNASANLMSFGSLDLTTYTRANVSGSALANTWAGVGAANATSTVTLSSDQQLLIGNGALIEALGSINLTAGGDFARGWESSLLANATAQSSIRGLIAIPAAMAKGSVDSRSRVDLDSGSRVLGARNVVIGAYNGVTRTAVDGTARGYQLGFIPVTSKDSRSEIKRDSYVTLDGQVLAGRYNELAITIDSNGALTQTSGLGVVSLYDPDFNPTDYLKGMTGIDGGISDVLASTLSSSVTGAWWLGPMMAAGGDITINADRLDGAGSLRAQGGATIEVRNRSSRYLVVGDALIPDQPGGNVLFTGGAGRDKAKTLTLEEINANRQGSILLENSYNGMSGNSTYGPALFLAGDIHNYGGLLRVYNARGSVGQFGRTLAQQVLVEVPEGAMTVYTPYAYWSVGSNPWSQWKNFAGLGFSVNYAVQLIANAVYGAGALSGNNQGVLVRSPVNSGTGGSSDVLFGNCLVAVGGYDCSKATANSFTGQSVQFRGIDNVDSWMPVIPLLSLYKESAGYNNAASDSSSRIVGGSVGIQAKYIDINATITSGAVTNRNVTIKADLTGWVEQVNQTCQSISCNQLIDIPAHLLEANGGSGLIRAKFDYANQRVVVDDVNASGGGFVYLKGGIISTNPNGRIQVNNGSGQVQVQNLSQYDLQLGRIDTGAGSIGIVQIVDTLKDKVNNRNYTTWYVHDQKAGLSIYDNGNGGTSIGTARLISSSSGNSANYDPKAGLRYQWQMWRYLQRSSNGSELGNWYWTSDDWSMGTGSVLSTGAGGPAYQQWITGSLDNWLSRPVNYHGCGDSNSCNWSFPRSGTYPEGHARAGEGYAQWDYRFAWSAAIRVTQSVKADNPFAIQFIGNGEGRIDVNAGQGNDLLLGGKLSNASGQTLLQAGGDVRALGGEGYSFSRDLRVAAGGRIGTDAQAFRASLSAENGTLSLSAANGINLQLDSAAVIEQVNAGLSNVRLAAYGNLLASQVMAPGEVHVRGGNLDLSSQTGSVGAPGQALTLLAQEVPGSNGGVSGGVVNVTANRDIALRETEGDFWVGRIASLTGDVSLEASQGALLDAGLRRSSSTLDAEQQALLWKKLKLTATDGGAQRAIDLAVKPFEQQINAAYREYWGLVQLGHPGAQGLELDADGVARYRQMLDVRSSIGLTDDQVRAAAQQRFDELRGLFTQELGTNWATAQEFTAFDQSFNYQASAAQIARLTSDAVWQEGELRYAIDINALGAGSSTPVGVTKANVSGRNVQLQAATNIGQLAAQLSIAFDDLRAGNLSAEQAAALAVATAPGDVRLDYDAANRPQWVRINQTVPFYVEAQGRLDASANGVAFLQAAGDVQLGELSANQDLRLAVGGSLLAADINGGRLRAGGGLVLQAGVGSMGTQLQPLQLTVGGRLLAASAGEDINLAWMQGDFRLGQLFAGGNMSLNAVNGSLLSLLPGVALNAQNLHLQAQGSLGSADKALDITLRTAAGRVTGRAGGLINLHSGSDMATGLLSAGGSLTLSSDADLRIGQLRYSGAQGGTLFDLRAKGQLLGGGAEANLQASVTGTTRLQAGRGIGSADARIRLDLPELTDVRAQEGDLYLELLSNVVGQRIQAVQGNVDLLSTSGAELDHVEAGGELRFQGYGLKSNTLISGADLQVQSAGDLQLQRVESGADLLINTTQRLQAEQLSSVGRLSLNAERADLTEVRAGGLAQLSADQAAIGRLSTGGDVSLDVSDLQLETLISGGAMSLQGTVAKLGDLQVIGDVNVNLTGDLTQLRRLKAGRDWSLQAVNATVGSAQVGGRSDMNLSGLLALEQLDVGNDWALQAGQARVGHATVQGAVTQTVGDLQIDHLSAQGLWQLNGATASVGDAAIGGHVDMRLSGNLRQLNQLRAGDGWLLKARNAQVNEAWVTGRSELDLQGDLAINQLSTSSDWVLKATNATVGDAKIQGNVLMVIDQRLNLDTLQGNGDQLGDWTLRAAEARIVQAILDGDVEHEVGSLSLQRLSAQGGWRLTGDTAAIGHADVTGPVTMVLSGDLSRLDQLQTAGAWSLNAHNARILQADVQGPVEMTLDGSLELGRLEGQDLWRLRANSAVVGEVQLTGTASLATQGDLRLEKLSAAQTAMTLGSASRIGELLIKGDLELTVNGSLDLLKANVTEDVQLLHTGLSGTPLHYGALEVGESLSVRGPGHWRGDAASVGGTAFFDVGAAELGVLESRRGELSLKASDRLAAEKLHSAMRFIDIEAGSTDLGQAVAADWLKVHSTGGTLRLDEGRSGTDLTLTSASGSFASIYFGELADPQAPNVLVPAHLKAGRDLLVQTDGDVFGGNAEAAGQLKLIGRNLHFGRAQSLQEDVFLQALGQLANGNGNITGLHVEAKRDVGIVANGDLSMPTVKFGGTYSLKAGRDLTVGLGGNLNLNGVAEAGRDLTFSIVGNVDLQGIRAGRHVSVDSGEYIHVSDKVEAGGNIVLRARNGDITVANGIFSSGQPYQNASLTGDILISASGDIRTSDISAAAGNVEAQGRHLEVNRLNASGEISLLAGGRIRVDSSLSQGRQDWLADEDIAFQRLLAGGQVLLDSLLDTRGGLLRSNQGAAVHAGWRDGVAGSGSIMLDSAQAPSLSLWAGKLVRVADAAIGQRADVHGQDIGLYGRHTGAGQLDLWVSGSGERFAQRLDARLQASDVRVPTFHVEDSRVELTGDSLEIADAQGVERMTLELGQSTVLMDNRSPAYLSAADVQLYELDKAFHFKQEQLVSSTDAYVLHRRVTHQVQVPNFTEAHDQTPDGIPYQGITAARFGEQILSDGFTAQRLATLMQRLALLPERSHWVPNWQGVPIHTRINLEQPEQFASDREGMQWEI